jgi:hypothetical protein
LSPEYRARINLNYLTDRNCLRRKEEGAKYFGKAFIMLCSKNFSPHLAS